MENRETGSQDQIDYQEPEADPMEYIKMYDIPGQDKTTVHSFLRYLKCKDNEQSIVDAAKNPAPIPEDKPEKDAKMPAAVLEYIKKFSAASGDAKVLIIEQGFTSEDADIRKLCAGAIWIEAPEGKKTTLLEKGLNSGSLDVQRECAGWICSAPADARNNLFQLAKEKLGDRLVEPKLYEKYNVNGDHFSRTEFKKTGSGTTLIGGKLKGKSILRHIAPESFLAWQKAFEDHELWKGVGFDYVPVEPIQSFKLNKDGLVDVSSGVLDLDFKEWCSMSGDFREELEIDMDRILKSLRVISVFHNHSHKANFCLKFFRDSDGHVDFSRKPRIYLIDFDRSAS